MTKILTVFIVGTVVLSGCSYSAEPAPAPAPRTYTASDAGMRTVDSQVVSIECTADFKTEDEEPVYWSYNEVRNVERLDVFLDHVERRMKDQVRVEAAAKDQIVELNSEGVIMGSRDSLLRVTDLKFDGERLVVTSEGETTEYEQIVVEERYNEHYNGMFVQYIAVGAEGQRLLILQIAPGLT